VIGFLPRITFSDDKLLMLLLRLEWGNVGKWKHLHTCYYIVSFLGLFGTLFSGGLVFILLCLMIYQAILTSSVLLVVMPSQRDLFYKLFGLQQCRKFGKKEITGSSTITKCAIQQVVVKIKSLTFMWLKGKYVNLPLNYHG